MANAKTTADRLAAAANKNGHTAKDLDFQAKRNAVGSARQLFLEGAKDLEVHIEGKFATIAEVKEFSTNSLGWYGNGKALIDIESGIKKSEWAPVGAPAKAKSIEVQIGENRCIAYPKHFSSGSVGWYISDKMLVKMREGEAHARCQVGFNITVVKSKDMADNTLMGSRVTVQLGLNLTIIGSKDLPRDEKVGAAAQ